MLSRRIFCTLQYSHLCQKEQIWSRNSYLTFKPHYGVGTAGTSAAFSYTAVFFDESWPTMSVSNDAKCQRNFREVFSTLNNIIRTFPNPIWKPRPVKMVWSLGMNIFRRANKSKSWTVSERKKISGQSYGTLIGVLVILSKWTGRASEVQQMFFTSAFRIKL